MNTIQNLLKSNQYIREFGKYIRRTVFHSKYIYFIASSTKPLSNQYGFDRGTPLDRYFIESFLEANETDIKGRCLEVLNNAYTLKYGGNRVTTCEIIDIEEANVNATIIDDLRNLQTISDNSFDCIILTQVLQFIDDVESAISECYRILAPRGVLLVTLPALSRADCTSGVDGDFWRFTQASAKYLFEKKFSTNSIKIDFFGNARSGIYFYAGLSIADTQKKVLVDKDENFPTIITVRASKNE